MTFVSASDNGVWDPVKRTVTWIVDLAKGESNVFSVIAIVSGYGNFTNSLVVGNNTTGVNVTVDVYKRQVIYTSFYNYKCI